MNENALIAVFVAATMAALVAIAWVGKGDVQHAETQHAEYCEKVETWKSQSHLPPEQRDGWPPFKGECDD